MKPKWKPISELEPIKTEVEIVLYRTNEHGKEMTQLVTYQPGGRYQSFSDGYFTWSAPEKFMFWEDMKPNNDWSPSSTINQVRQVIVNEHGITKEYIRQMTSEIVEREVRIRMNELLVHDRLDIIGRNQIHVQFNNMLGGGMGRNRLEEIVVAEAMKVARDFVKERLVLKVESND